jgi:hypothetical protein
MMEDTGRTSGGFEVPEGSSYALSFPHVDTAESSNPSTLTPPAESGLSGASMATPAGNPDMGKPQPIQPAPHPAETAARGVFAALSGSSGHPMDWARATIAGGLAAAANVGQVAPGQGFLAGVGKGAQAIQQRQDQQQAIARQQQQQQFENQEKLKQDERQQQQLQNELQNSTAQRALYTAQTAASIQTAQQSAARFPTLAKEDQARYQQLSDQIQQSEADNKSILSAAGVDITKLQHITSTDQLTDSHAQQAGNGSIFAIPNGEAHKEGEDGAGAYLVPGDVWGMKTKEPVTITTGWDIDAKTGKPTPKTTTAAAGTPVSDLLAIAKGAQNDLAAKQKQIIDQANVVKGANAAADEALNQQQKRAEIAHQAAETKQIDLANAQVGALNQPGSENLQGEQYLSTLPQSEQNSFKAIAEGRAQPINLQNRKGELTPAGQAFMRAYPDYDIGKAKEYSKGVTEFTTGQTGKAIVAMGTGINHLRAAYDNTNASSFVPGTAENKRYNQDVTFVSEELGKYLKGGVATEGEVHAIQDGLKSSVPWLRKAALENAAHIIEGRRSEIEQQWKNIQVRPSYQPPLPNMSKTAEDNLAYIQSGGKRTSAAQLPTPPQGATMKVPGSDGKMYWSDGKNNLGLVQ